MDLIGGALDLLHPPPWEPKDRPVLLPHQIPPGPLEDESWWSLWLLMAGRGAGKTEACSRHFAAWMRAHPGERGRIIAPTFGDAVEACVEGPSGLKAVDPDVRWIPSAPGGSKVVWPNGSEALVLGTPTPNDVERLRAAGNRGIDWWEEMAANRQLAKAWDQAKLGLRYGYRPHSIASTTPRRVLKLKELIADPRTVLTRASMRDNPHLSDEFVAEVESLYAGTRLEAQEIDGILLDDVEGALWNSGLLGDTRVEPSQVPPLRMKVVGVDPAFSEEEQADEAGILVAGLGTPTGLARQDAYVLEDRTCRGGLVWPAKAVEAYWEHECRALVCEANLGGADYMRRTIHAIDPRVNVVTVHARQGKQTRAEPVALLYDRNRAHHVGEFPLLEAEQTGWVPGEASPNRLDALVWALTHLMPEINLSGAASAVPTRTSGVSRVPSRLAR